MDKLLLKWTDKETLETRVISMTLHETKLRNETEKHVGLNTHTNEQLIRNSWIKWADIKKRWRLDQEMKTTTGTARAQAVQMLRGDS